MKLSDVARALGSEIVGNADLEVSRLVHPADAKSAGDLALALTKDALPALSAPAVAAVVKAGVAAPAGFTLIPFAGHERMALAILTRLFDPGPVHANGVHPSASIAADATLGDGVSIGANASVGSGSRIGAGTVILANASIGSSVVVGRDCVIYPGARIEDRVVLGDRVRLSANAVVGADGFGFIPVRNPDGTRNPIETPVRIHSLATVILGDDVDIGAGTTIDRGTLRDTRIGRGTKVDNHVQIAHNVVIGECCIVCGMAGIGGSSELGDRVILGAAVGVGDHIRIGSDAVAMAGAAVVTNVNPGTVVGGYPAVPRDVAIERHMNVARLKTLYPKVDRLEKRLGALEKDKEAG